MKKIIILIGNYGSGKTAGPPPTSKITRSQSCAKADATAADTLVCVTP